MLIDIALFSACIAKIGVMVVSTDGPAWLAKVSTNTVRKSSIATSGKFLLFAVLVTHFQHYLRCILVALALIEESDMKSNVTT